MTAVTAPILGQAHSIGAVRGTSRLPSLGEVRMERWLESKKFRAALVFAIWTAAAIAAVFA